MPVKSSKVSGGSLLPADKNTCIVELTVGGFASYVDLLTCLEMSNDVRKEANKSQRFGMQTESRRRWGQGRPEK